MAGGEHRPDRRRSRSPASPRYGTGRPLGRRRWGLVARLAWVLALTSALAGAAWLADGADPRPGQGSPRNAASAVAAAPPPQARPVVPAPSAVDLTRADLVRVRLRHPPRAGLLFDLGTGRVLWLRHPRAPLPVASLTKVMTALLVAERTGPRERVRITKAALRYEGQGVGLLPEGRRVPIEALLHGMLLTSGNDAALALAEHVAGSERSFVRLMNRRARQLSLRCTRFVSPHGLEPGNRSCAADLAALTRLALDEYRVARVVRKPQAMLRFPIRGGRLYVTSTNPLLLSGYRGAIGLKTGYTTEAGRTFIAVARRRGRTLGVVLLHSPEPALQARRLLNAGFRRLRR